MASTNAIVPQVKANVTLVMIEETQAELKLKPLELKDAQSRGSDER